MWLRRQTAAYRGGSRIILRGAIVTRSDLGLATDGNDEAKILNHNIVDKLIPKGSQEGYRTRAASDEGPTRLS